MENFNKKYSLNDNNKNSVIIVDSRYEFDAARYYDFSKDIDIKYL